MPRIVATVPSVATHAETLRALHVPGRPLVLPNAWSTASARAVVEAGFPVVATSSAALNELLGFADDGSGDPAAIFAALAGIAAAVDVPVTADIEDGYGLDAEALAEALLDAGVAGCNLEDSDHAHGGLVPGEQHAERIAALKAAARSRGVELVVNARIDCFVRDVDRADAPRRARLYRDAGADCVYPILMPEDELPAFLAAAPGPTNVLARVEDDQLRRFAALGVARISFGAGLSRVNRPLPDSLARIARQQEEDT